MKFKIIALSVLGFIICTAFIKPKALVTDYRDTYTGTYFCNRTTTTALLGQRIAPKIIKDTVSILVAKDIEDSTMRITIQGGTYKMKLKNTTNRAYLDGGRNRGVFFDTDSISFSTPLGHAGAAFYVGKKR